MEIDKSQSVISSISMYRNDAASKKLETDRQAEKTQSAQPDTVQLSTRKDEIEKLKSAVSSISDVRAEKVAALKQQVSEGTYRVDGIKIAEKIAQTWKGARAPGEMS
jgi:negative regulator of flagellin synthesis FlgM